MVSRFSKISLWFWLLFVLGVLASLFVMFKAGCAGDTKGGALGDLDYAQRLEMKGLLISLFIAVSGGIAFGLRSKSRHYVAHGLSFAIFTLVCLWLAGMQCETSGTQACF